MKVKRFPRLFLVFTALVVTVCRCSFDRGFPVLISFSDGSSMKCNQFGDYRAVGGNSSTFDCDLPCPDGSAVPLKELSSPELIKAVTEKGKVPASVLQGLQKQYCTAASLLKATATPRVTATPRITATPTRTPTKTPTLAPNAASVLTGEVTACNVPARYINLRLSQPKIDFTANTVIVLINGISASCVFPTDNPTVLSCTLPQPQTTFPINIIVRVNNRPVNNFTFNGSYCGYKDPSLPNNNPQNNDNPPATPNPNQQP